MAFYKSGIVCTHDVQLQEDSKQRLVSLRICSSRVLIPFDLGWWKHH